MTYERVLSGSVIPDSLCEKRPRSCVNVPPSCLLITLCACTYLRLSSLNKSFRSTLNFFTLPPHSRMLVSLRSSLMFNERLEVDAAKAARELLTTYNVPEEQTRTAWQAIALHT